MEKSYMQPDALLEFAFLQERRTGDHTHENPELLFVLEGKLHVKADQQEFLLENEDFILVNAGRTHSYRAEGNLLAVRFQISLAKLRRMLHQNTAVFWCCSVLDKGNAAETVRRTLREIILGSVNRGERDDFYLQSLHYRLCSELCANFLLEENRGRGSDSAGSRSSSRAGSADGSADAGLHAGKDRERMDQIMDYIRMNYKSPISLQDVADELFLSPAYLSRFIHKTSGRGFVDLISSVRLGHAMEDLMYTDAPVTKIAMDNGFPSVAALNKAFREVYDTTPSEYRKEKKKAAAEQEDEENLRKTAEYLRQHRESSLHAAGDAGNSSIHIRFYKAADDSGNPAGELEILEEEKEERCPSPEAWAEQKSPVPSVRQSLNAGEAPEVPDLRNSRQLSARQILNAGRASDLRQASTQREILYCKEHLGTTYVRFWNLYEPEMYLDADSRKKNKKGLHFGRLDEILDFLVGNGLKPYIELRSKDLRVFGTVDRLLHQRDAQEDFSDQRDRTLFFEELAAHLARRYGRGEVNTWIFDYTLPVNARFESGDLIFSALSEQAWDRYLEEFDMIATSLRVKFPQAEIGGAGFPVHHYGAEGLEVLFQKWKNRRALPDFISVTSFPYQIVREGGKWYEKRRTDMDFVREDVEAARKGMEEGGFSALPLHLTEYNLTLSDRSHINDSLTRAAFVAHTVRQVYGMVDFLGLWNVRDAYVEFADSAGYLFGGSGILTKTGAAKPAFHVLSFLHRLYTEAACGQDGCLVTANVHGHFKILAHHLVNMSTAYYLKDESSVLPLEIDQMPETREKKTVHIRIEGLPEGSWQIRKYCLNRRSGSILNEWLNLDMELELRQEELQYLERICMPRLFIQRRHTQRGTLEFDIELEPNEVQYLHVTEFE